MISRLYQDQLHLLRKIVYLEEVSKHRVKLVVKTIEKQ